LSVFNNEEEYDDDYATLNALVIAADV